MNTPFDYPLPAERIAQRPVYPYDSAKLLCCDRATGRIVESRFSAIPEYLRPGDVLVFNETRVIPARLFGKKITQAGSVQIELLLLQELNSTTWRCLGKPLKKLKIDDIIRFSDELQAIVVARPTPDRVDLSFETLGAVPLAQALHAVGIMPIPPYIRGGAGDEKDALDYQSVFARVSGSVAAPTASLHFTERLLQEIEQVPCNIERVLLHVGAASFVPVQRDGETELRAPEAEVMNISAQVLQRLQQAKQEGRRVIAVGTTVVRALESAVAKNIQEGPTDLFITPGHSFQIVDAIITNFHQPKTTHLLLVEAFLGRNLLDLAYTYALQHEFRFLSYGDGMLIV